MAIQQERAELHKTIWKIANDLRGSVDGWEFKAYVLGSIFYRFISENICDYIHQLMNEAGQPDFDYAKISDEMAENIRQKMVEEKGYFILPSQLFQNVVKTAESGEKKQTVIDKLKAYFSRFFNLLSEDTLEYDYYRTQKLDNIEDDKEVRDLVFNLLHMDGDISDMQIQRMVIERFGSKYAGMSLNDWRHIIESYTSMVREALNSKAKEVVLQLKKAAEPEPLNLKK